MNADIEATDRIVRRGRRIVIGVVCLFSLATGGPTMAQHMPAGWDLAGYLLPIALDTTLITVAGVEDALARLGGKPGFWGTLLRAWVGLSTVIVNVYDSVVKRDIGGVLLHGLVPVLLLLISETAPVWARRVRAAADELAAKEAEEQAARERSRRAHEEEERARQKAAREAEKAELREAAEEAAHDRSRATQEAIEAEERKARIARETAEHAARLERERFEREESARDRELRIQREEADAERQREADERAVKAREQERVKAAEQARKEAARKAAEAAEAEARERRMSAIERVVSTGEKMTEDQAMAELLECVRAGLPQSEIMRRTGWSAGWVSARVKAVSAPAPAAGPLQLVKQA